jgi:Exostosin family
MRLYLPRVALNQWTDLAVDELEALAAADRFNVHELVEDPDDADVVLFAQCHMVDWRLRAIRGHPVSKSNWEKVMVYDERDRPWRSFPGLYVSVPSASFDPRRQRACSYLRLPGAESDVAPEADLLFSFVGSPTATCRRPLFDLQHPRSIVEEVQDFVFWDSASPDFVERRRRYREILTRSRFVLCPRGRGTSSFRLYETLAAGRVPVIISDDWVAPLGPDWGAFSLRAREGATVGLVDMLEAQEEDWPSMSAAAAAAYREYFSREVLFHRLVELLQDLCDLHPVRSRRWTMRSRAVHSAARDFWGRSVSSPRGRLDSGSY